MNAQVTPLTADTDPAALRAAFRAADTNGRQALLPLLAPQEVEFAGVRMWVDPRDNYTERRIWLDGQPPEMESLLALVELVEGRRALVLDIGANCGAFAVPLGLAVGPGSAVIAFEPNPVMIQRLQHNIALNGLEDVVRVEGCALGAEPGEATLNLKHGNYGQASLMPIRPRQRAGGTQVPVRALTEFISAADDYEITVIKIDVEGAEEMALGPLLADNGWLPDAVLMETRHADDWEGDLIAQIQALGFENTLEVEGNTLFVRGKAR